MNFTKEELKKAYEYGQSDCGEFGNVMGFDPWFEELIASRDSRTLSAVPSDELVECKNCKHAQANPMLICCYPQIKIPRAYRHGSPMCIKGKIKCEQFERGIAG